MPALQLSNLTISVLISLLGFLATWVVSYQTMGSATMLNNIETRAHDLKDQFEVQGQGHVFKFFDGLSATEKFEFLEQLEKVPICNLNSFFIEATKEKKGNIEGDIIPVERSVVVKIGESRADEERWYHIGLQAIREGKVAVVTLAGGQGTRLGSSSPKGTYDIGLPSHKSLFQLQAERLIRLGQLAGSSIKWYIMTSGPTHQNTVEFFKANCFFGMNESLVTFFQQGVLPALTLDGKIFLQTKSSLALAPDGNGGIYAALKRDGIIDEFEKSGIEYVHMHSVDNCLVKMADPLFVGLCLEREVDCASKSVPKVDPKESVGILSRRNSDQRLLVAEYSELDPKLADAINESGELLFNTANIAVHLFSTQFLRQVCYDPKFALPYHVAKKKIPSVDMATGEALTTPPVGIKLEAFIFDVLELATNPIILQVDRSAEFAPLKNAPGSAPDDTPEACCARLYNLHRRWLTLANAMVDGEPGSPCEISPLISYSGEGLEEHSGTVVSTPIHIERKAKL